MPPAPMPLSVGPSACIGGAAGDFACSAISLRKRVSLSTMGGSSGNDVWGWVDPGTGNEYALVGMNTGTAFVDVTDPESPVFLGRLPTETNASVWRDIKVYQNHAYVVADAVGSHGMQVFDLSRLAGVTVPETFVPDTVYTGFGSAHNVAINESSGFAYAVGADTCEGLHIVDITTPVNPMFAHCYNLVDTHDTQCVNYIGPDPDHTNSEICVSSNGNHVEIVDVSFKPSPVSLSMTSYAGSGFVHQGWLTEDHRYFLLGDELDEANNGHRTRTYVFDVSDLDAPVLAGFHESTTPSIDHNLYVSGGRVYEANYSSGLRILDIGDLSIAELNEIAFFDTVPNSNVVNFVGAWSVYPFLPSGNLLVSDTESGLFILTAQ